MLDEKDKIILESLFQDARLTTKELAKIAHITQPAAYKRMKKLEQKGYISSYDSIINWQALPFIKIVYFCNELNVERIIKEKCCFAIQEMIGEFKYQIFCFFKNRIMQKEFENLLPKKYKKETIAETHWNSVSIFDTEVKVKKSKPKLFNNQKINEKDIKILEALGEGGARKTIRELSNQLGISEDIIWQRKKLLVKNGYFMQFFAQPNSKELLLTVTYVYIKTNRKIQLNPKRAIFSMRIAHGQGFALVTSSHNDYLNALDSIFSQLHEDIKDAKILTVKKNILLNRYPFEFLINKS